MNSLLKHFISSETQAPVTSGDVGYLDSKMGGWHNPQEGILAEGFRITADDTVLDVGCGAGGAASFAAGQGAETKVTWTSALLHLFTGIPAQTGVVSRKVPAL